MKVNVTETAEIGARDAPGAWLRYVEEQLNALPQWNVLPWRSRERPGRLGRTRAYRLLRGLYRHSGGHARRRLQDRTRESGWNLSRHCQRYCSIRIARQRVLD